MGSPILRSRHAFTVFATTAGIALSIALLIFTLTDKVSRRKFIHTIFLLLVLVLSLLFGLFPAYAGIIQRILWIVGFSWLVFMYNSSPAASDRDTIDLQGYSDGYHHML